MKYKINMTHTSRASFIQHSMAVFQHTSIEFFCKISEFPLYIRIGETWKRVCVHERGEHFLSYWCQSWSSAEQSK